MLLVDRKKVLVYNTFLVFLHLFSSLDGLIMIELLVFTFVVVLLVNIDFEVEAATAVVVDIPSFSVISKLFFLFSIKI